IEEAGYGGGRHPAPIPQVEEDAVQSVGRVGETAADVVRVALPPAEWRLRRFGPEGERDAGNAWEESPGQDRPVIRPRAGFGVGKHLQEPQRVGAGAPLDRDRLGG